MIYNWNKSQFADYDTTPADAKKLKGDDGEFSYTLRARRYSHWYMDENKEYVFPSPDKAKTDDRWYAYDERFSNRDTAYLIMDPWSNMPCDFLNNYVTSTTNEAVVPMACAAAESGHKVIILTDLTDAPYNSKIAPELQNLVDRGLAQIQYHDNYTGESFAEFLSGQGIKNLIYCGYFSNICVLFRPTGIVNMTASGKFNVYFVPQAAVSIEHRTSWESGMIHTASTVLISQTQAMLLELNDIIDAIKEK